MKRLTSTFQEPPVMWVILLINCALFALVHSKDPTISALTLREFGAQYNPDIWAGESYRLLLAGFLHGSFTHLVMNNLSLYFLGKLLEQLMGSTAFLILYILSLLAGSVASMYYMPPTAVSVGASGAIMGLAGALFVLLLLDRRGRFLTAQPFGRYMFFVLVIFYLFIGKIFPIINSSAHIGGFVMGCVFGVFFWSRIPGEKIPRWVGSTLLFSGIVGLSLATMGGMKPKDTYAWHLHHGLEGYHKGNNQDAVRHLKIAVQKQPTSMQAPLYLGQLYFYTKQYPKAITMYRKLTQKAPNQDHWYYLILSLHHNKQHKKAEATYQQALLHLKKQDKNRSWFRTTLNHEQIQLWRRAHLLAAHRKEKEALLLYQRLLKKHPESITFRNEIAWLLVTATDPKYRNPALALKHANIAIKKVENPPASLLDTFATVLFMNGRTQDAIKQIKQALLARGAKQIMPHLRQQLKRFKAKRKTEKKKAVKKKAVKKKP